MSSVHFAFVEVANGFWGKVFPGYRSLDRFLVHNYLRGWGEGGETPSVDGFAEQNLRECTTKQGIGQILRGEPPLFVSYKGIYNGQILWYSLVAHIAMASSSEKL